jgi:hypothetical protein
MSPVEAEFSETNLGTVICHILKGERDEDSLVDPLDLKDAMVVSAILRSIAGPAILQAILGNS